MNQTSSQQLREAADIIEGNLEFEVLAQAGHWFTPAEQKSPVDWLKQSRIRRKPWTLGRSINGHTLAEGQQWHRQDWAKEMLPEDYRPLLLGEQEQKEDWAFILGDWSKDFCGGGASRIDNFRRTKRPLPLTSFPPPPEGHEWHNPAGIKPSDLPPGRRLAVKAEIYNREKKIKETRAWSGKGWEVDNGLDGYWMLSPRATYSLPIDMPLQLPPLKWAAERKAFKEGKIIQARNLSSNIWTDLTLPPRWFKDQEYRIKPSPKLIPLGPDDVPPASAIKYLDCEWRMVSTVVHIGLYHSQSPNLLHTWAELQRDQCQIKRPGEAWKPCYKEVEE